MTFVLGTLLLTVFLTVAVLVTLVNLEFEFPTDCPEASAIKGSASNDDKVYILINVFIISKVLGSNCF